MTKTPWTGGPWLIAASRMVYALEDFRRRNGSIWQRNRITIQVDGGPDTPKEEVAAVVGLIAAAPEMAEAMQWFCDRVDAGEVRSTKTYNRFKSLLAKARGETS